MCCFTGKWRPKKIWKLRSTETKESKWSKTTGYFWKMKFSPNMCSHLGKSRQDNLLICVSTDIDDTHIQKKCHSLWFNPHWNSKSEMWADICSIRQQSPYCFSTANSNPSWSFLNPKQITSKRTLEAGKTKQNKTTTMTTKPVTLEASLSALRY